MKNRVDTLRKKTPWDNEDNATTLQIFIMDKYKETYNFKHPILAQSNEYHILNYIEITKCRCCSSSNIIKRRITINKVQLYYCKDCKKYFTPAKGTIFENHKISITEGIEFLLDIFNHVSTSLTSKVNKKWYEYFIILIT